MEDEIFLAFTGWAREEYPMMISTLEDPKAPRSARTAPDLLDPLALLALARVMATLVVWPAVYAACIAAGGARFWWRTRHLPPARRFRPTITPARRAGAGVPVSSHGMLGKLWSGPPAHACRQRPGGPVAAAAAGAKRTLQSAALAADRVAGGAAFSGSLLGAGVYHRRGGGQRCLFCRLICTAG